jgi:hypothetical protein
MDSSVESYPRFLLRAYANASTCEDFTSCSSCISSADLECTWCSDSNTCGDSSTTHCSQSQLSTCNETIYAIVIIVVIVTVIFICCSGCYLKRYLRRSSDRASHPQSGFLSSTARSFLFRNSLLGDGQKEWMCVICGFDNHPRNKHCNMCGTSHEFTVDYKKEKSERRKIMKEKQRIADANNRKNRKDKKSVASVRNPIQYPFDAQISGHQVMSLSASAYVTPSKNYSKFQTLLSTEQKTKALNYRRINQLTLRQKSARRRKMWQRKYDPKTRELCWVRVPLSDIRINDAPFGYTPRNSMSESYRLFQSPASMNESSINSSNALVAASDPGRILLEAAASGCESHQSSEARDDSSSNHSQASNLVVPGLISFGTPTVSTQKMSANVVDHSRYRGRSREPSDDSFDDRALLSYSPGFSSVLDSDGNLTWERVDPSRPLPANKRSQKTSAAPKQPVAFSSQPDDYSLTSPLLPASSHIAGDSEYTTLPSIAVNDEREAMIHDLETIASLTFKEKQLWFLDRMSEIQRPLTDGWVRLNIRREHLLEESAASLLNLSTADLHKWMRVQFVGEPGIDAGGLEREWFSLVTKELFSQQHELFLCSSGDASGGTYHINPISGLTDKHAIIPSTAPQTPSPASSSSSSQARRSPAIINPKSLNYLDYYKFAGRLIGKAIMEQQPLPATLSLPLRKQILTTPITFSDLEFVDVDLHKNLLYLQNDCEDVAALDMDFTVTYRSHGKTLQCNLVEEGENVAVTNANKDLYLQLRLRHRMFDSIKIQLEAMLKGIYEVIPPDLLSVFDYQELDLLLCGVPDIDIEDWKTHTEYMGEFTRSGAKHKVIKWFWKAVEDMSSEERVRLLQFVTGCGRLPAQGFKALQSSDGKYRKFNIQSISKRDSLYPRAHTCFNKLDLPIYDSSSELDAYLSVVINMEVTGFTME